MPLARRAFAVLGAACVWAAPVSAQRAEGPSIFTLLSPSGSLEIGSDLTGTLTPSDFLSEGRRVRAYALQGQSGAPVTIEVMSDDFDAYLYLIGPDGTEIGSDDDAGGACTARLSLVLPWDGTYMVVAGAWGNATGAFTIRTDDHERAPATERCDGGAIQAALVELFTSLEPGGSLAVGQGVTGTLADGDPQMGDGSFLDAYLLTGTPGQRVVVDLVSRSFDALLYVVDPAGKSYTTDDDAGGACNARAEVTLGTEPHLIVVNSLSAAGTGAYTVRVSEDWGPESDEPCPGG